MKANYLKITVIFASAALLAFATQCKEDKEEPSTSLQVTKNIASKCGEHLNMYSAKSLEEDESFEIISFYDGVISIIHKNWAVPCDYTKAETKVHKEGSIIYVTETTDGGMVNCICNIDHAFQISGLSDETYTIVFMVGDTEVYRKEVVPGNPK